MMPFWKTFLLLKQIVNYYFLDSYLSVLQKIMEVRHVMWNQVKCSTKRGRSDQHETRSQNLKLLKWTRQIHIFKYSCVNISLFQYIYISVLVFLQFIFIPTNIF